METTQLGLHVGLLALPEEGTRALVDGLYLTKTTSSWKVDQHRAHELSGALDDHFGSLEFCLGLTGLVNEIAGGRRLTIEIPGEELITLDIANAQHDFERFLTCHRPKVR
jgi:hypothetical protein